MRVIVDPTICNGHGDCVMEAPEVFDLGDDAEVAVVLDDSPAEDMRPQVERASAMCPVAAIRIEG